MEHHRITSAYEANTITLDEAISQYIWSTDPESVARVIREWHFDALARLPDYLARWPTTDTGWSERWVCGSAHVSDERNAIVRAKMRAVIERLRTCSLITGGG